MSDRCVNCGARWSFAPLCPNCETLACGECGRVECCCPPDPPILGTNTPLSAVQRSKAEALKMLSDLQAGEPLDTTQLEFILRGYAGAMDLILAVVGNA